MAHTIRRLFGTALPLILAGAASPAPAQEPTPGNPVELPVRYDDHRFYVRPVLAGGDTLEFYTDTGGGEMMIYPEVVRRLGLRPDTALTDGRPIASVAFPGFRPGAGIPTGGGRTPGRLIVFPPHPLVSSAEHGFLGQGWFSGRVWTFDYPGRKLLLRAPGDLPQTPPEHRVPLFFKTDSAGARVLDFPRIRVLVDGDSLDLLFDTGATTVVADSVVARLADGRPARRATSFISESVAARWRQRHPDWRVVQGAEHPTGLAMIEVPRISVAGHEVGPVWFTYRLDRSFSQFMSPLMDRAVVGALGGTALQYFRVTVDYPGAVAVFERP